MARESNELILWDDQYWITRFDSDGRSQGKVHQSARIVSATISEDGTAIVAADQSGSVFWYRPDFSIRWQESLPSKPLCVALDAPGSLVAMCDSDSQLHLFDDHGIVQSRIKLPRPLHQLRWCPGESELVGISNYGFVVRVNPQSGAITWRDTPVIHHGGLAILTETKANSLQSQAIVACFSDGVRGYDSRGNPMRFHEKQPACRDVATAVLAPLWALAGVEARIDGFRDSGAHWFHLPTASPAVGIALESSGERLYAALQDSTICCLKLPRPK
ncbi:hypothetical protein [Tuwongella immobilis]|nr:hypothetical protein [Tuwongella immobilis]